VGRRVLNYERLKNESEERGRGRGGGLVVQPLPGVRVNIVNIKF
jgi:hypothetical protein